ncbi:unnamed protein product [Gordionus sp. m RMFG-2023]
MFLNKNLYYFFLFCILLKVKVNALSCPCQSRSIKCNFDPPTDCEGGLVTDACGCCKVCAKVEGEICGGPYMLRGKCGKGLMCVLDDYEKQVNALSCPCQSRSIKCNVDPPTDCEGGLVTDACGCCKVCAKVSGEICGGLYMLGGKCGKGLMCALDNYKKQDSNGTCIRSSLKNLGEPCKTEAKVLCKKEYECILIDNKFYSICGKRGPCKL